MFGRNILQGKSNNSNAGMSQEKMHVGFQLASVILEGNLQEVMELGDQRLQMFGIFECVAQNVAPSYGLVKYWVVPLPSNSHHQDDITCLGPGFPTKTFICHWHTGKGCPYQVIYNDS